MLINPGYGNSTGGGGTGFLLFTQSNNDPGIYADASARDVYFGANPDELARLDADEFLIIKLLDNGSGEIAYQQRSGGNWLDVTSLVQGEPGLGDGGSTYGTLTNSDILALGAVLENETADSSDDNIRYTFISSAWRSTGGGLLV